MPVGYTSYSHTATGVIAMSDGDANEPFQLGTWLVQPSLNRLSDGDQVVTIEPRVMDTLV